MGVLSGDCQLVTMFANADAGTRNGERGTKVTNGVERKFGPYSLGHGTIAQGGESWRQSRFFEIVSASWEGR